MGKPCWCLNPSRIPFKSTHSNPIEIPLKSTWHRIEDSHRWSILKFLVEENSHPWMEILVLKYSGWKSHTSWWFIPLFMGLHPRWCRISQPSAACWMIFRSIDDYYWLLDDIKWLIMNDEIIPGLFVAEENLVGMPVWTIPILLKSCFSNTVDGCEITSSWFIPFYRPIIKTVEIHHGSLFFPSGAIGFLPQYVAKISPMIFRPWALEVIDFGAARREGKTEDVVLQTLPYRAPEARHLSAPRKGMAGSTGSTRWKDWEMIS